MSTGYRIAVIGNCQARPLASLVQLIDPKIQISGVIITHLGKPEHKDKDYETLNAADIVLAQFVQDAYPVAHLRTSVLRSEFGGKLLVWPNLFFKGQTPDLVYLTAPNLGRVVGPLGEYQNVFVYEAWKAGATVSEVLHRLATDDGWAERCRVIAEESLRELERRAAASDAPISEMIRAEWRQRRMFFTFNHPSNLILLAAATELARRSGLAKRPNADLASRPEPLDRIIPMMPDIVRKRLDASFPAPPLTRGCQVVFSEGKSVKFTAQKVDYPLESLVETTFRSLEAQIRPDTQLRIT